MPASSESILTSGHILSYLTDMRDGVGASFTTPSVNIGGQGFRANRPLVLDVFIPAMTTRNPATPGVGVYTRPYMSLVIQENGGNPATEAGWRDVTWVKQIRPHVPAGSTGSGAAGGLSTAVFSNRFRIGFQSDKSNIRLSGSVLGSFADFSQFYAAIVPAIGRQHELD
jgi:hypothetical protein